MKKWLVISLGIVAVLLILAFSTTNLGTHISNFTEIYADEALHKDALDIANNDPKVMDYFGRISVKDNLSLLNGDVQYSEDHSKVELTFKVKGSKENGVMDIKATRNAEVWEYQSIILRSKDKKIELN
ncbi:cytochrome c oxidase assembly factor Coa1 family protein [Zunongwangia pacifica]|uniref:Cytochrome c oxidase assembly factor 1 family protein n=1 Tax=Zunongwangia pacifica TaxID=2911062 RepID=A0A9X2A4K1_9FLAO|nr:cytochrome c oxidase assembly factor Coa1 family protein [Zunongwangia pacifica]MCL6220294.1 cytochrome c oxidase assembly factor 1 family protein [Zunongwangia pacifica]